MHRFLNIIIALLLCCWPLFAQQVADTEYKPPITKPAYEHGKGPLVLLDEAHNNFHTASGRYQTFAELLRRDGYVVQAATAKFSPESLKPAKILVIANALHERNANNWTLPTPSAFTDEEIAAVRDWVNKGGALLLIADHMPFPGAAEKLGAAFDIKFTNGYVRNQKQQGGPDLFQRAAGSLRAHPITNGRNAAENVDAVATFTGSAFQIPNAQPLLVLSEAAVSVLTSTAGQITPDTPREPVPGWWQGAVFKAGKGRVAVFGEAAMFSAQLAGPNRNPMGMNAPEAKQNYQFLLNVMHWLSGILS
ncbi:MAG TPA: DUF4350 domain-containing protein [Blastocatellia bacterium]|nr:DUF4350 domain-containing protein [Blastocatellia bacterium]